MQCQKIRIRCPTKVASVFKDTSKLKTKKEQPKQATLLFLLLLPAEREGHKILEFEYRNSLIISASFCQNTGIFQGFSFLYRATFQPLQQYPQPLIINDLVII